MAARALSPRGDVGVRMSWRTGGPGRIAGRDAGVRRKGTGKAGVRWPAAGRRLPSASAAVAAVTGSCVTAAGGRRASARDAAHAKPGIGGVSWGAGPFAGTAAPPAEAFCLRIRSTLPPGRYAAASQAAIARAGFPLTPCAFRWQGAAGLIGA